MSKIKQQNTSMFNRIHLYNMTFTRCKGRKFSYINFLDMKIWKAREIEKWKNLKLHLIFSL